MLDTCTRQTPIMEIQSYEFTVEDILNIHRPWITKLYIDDRKTPVEIVGLLDERKLFVSLFQLQLCLREWNLSLDQSITTSTSEISRAISESTASPASFNAYHRTTDPETVVKYQQRPLPSLPPQAAQKSSHHQVVLEDQGSTGYLALQRNHTPLNSSAPPEVDPTVQTFLDDLSQQIQPQENAEARATMSTIILGKHRRAADLRGGSARMFSPKRRIKGPGDRSRRKQHDD